MRFPHLTPAWIATVPLVFFCCQQVGADDAARQYALAKGLYARAQWDAAEEEFQSFLSRHADHPQVPEAEFYLGEALVQKRQFEKAAPHFHAYLEAEPQGEFRKLALFRVAECAFFAKDESAESNLANFSDRFPDDRLNGLALSYRATAALRRGAAQEAEPLFRESLDRFPKAASRDECRIGLARSLEAQGNLEEAERYYLAVAAKRRSPKAVEAKYRLGSLQYARRQYAAALETLRELDSVPASDPWAAAARLGKGWALVKLDQQEEAARVFSALVSHPAAGVEARYWLGVCRKAEKDWKGATETLLGVAKELSAKSVGGDGCETAGNVTATAAFFHAGDSQLAAGNPRKARELFTRAIASGDAPDPWLDEAHRALVQSSLRLKDYPRARSDAERFLNDRPDSEKAAAVLRLLARVQLEQEDFPAAEHTLCRLDEVKLRAADQSPLLEDEYLLALSYQGQDRYQTAMGVLKPVLAGATGKLAADARLVEASLLAAMKRYEEALASLAIHEGIPESEPNRREAAVLSAACHAQLGQVDKAMERYREATIGAESPLPLQWNTAEQIAQAALHAQQYDRAERMYNELIEAASDEERRNRGLIGAAWTRYEQGNYASARTTLTELIQKSPNPQLRAEALYVHGRVLRELDEPKAACAAFEKIAEEHAESAYGQDALWNAAQLHEKLGRPEKAAARYEQMVERGPDVTRYVEAVYSLAWIRQEAGDSEQAIRLFRRIVDEHRDSPYWAHAVLTVAQHHFDAGRSVEAAAEVEDLLENAKNSALRDRALYLAGQIAFGRGRWADARSHFERVALECPGSELVRQAAFGAAEAAFQAGEPDALHLFEQLVAETDRLPETLLATARMRLAQLYAEAERWDDATLMVQSFSREHPSFSQQYELDYVRGRTLAARALFDEAREAYEKVIRSPAGDRTETAAKAQLMIAETYFHQRRYAEAYRAYMQVEILYDFPELQAAALLQAGKFRQLEGNADSAAGLYHQVVKNYPETRAAEQAARNLRGDD